MDPQLCKGPWGEARDKRTIVTVADDLIVPPVSAVETMSRSQGTATAPPCVTTVSMQTPREEQGPVTAPPCSTVGPTSSASLRTTEVGTQWQDPAMAPPCPASVQRLPMMAQDVVAIAMARTFWFQNMSAMPTIATALGNAFTTAESAQDLCHHLEWVHVGRRDLVHFLMQWMANESREGRTAEAMFQNLWLFLSHMQQ